MQSLGTASFAGLWLLASCARAQPIVSRGQYSVSFKIVGGKLAVDRDAFHVAPSYVKFEAAIQEVGGRSQHNGSSRPSLLVDSAWPDYIVAYQAWSAADPDRLDLGNAFLVGLSLFVDLLQQAPDSGLILNEDEIDPLERYDLVLDLAAFDSNTVSIELPAMLESRRRARLPQLRKRLARLNGSLWSSAAIRKAFAPLYANLGLTPQIIFLPRNQTIQIVEGPANRFYRFAGRSGSRARYRSVAVASARHRSLSEGARGKRTVDFDRDLGYARGRRALCHSVPDPSAAAFDLASRLHLRPPKPSTRTGASQYVDLRVKRRARRSESRHLRPASRTNRAKVSAPSAIVSCPP